MTVTPTKRRNTPPPHGTRRRYHYWKCRCVDCGEANRIHDKRRRENRAPSSFTDPTGTVRRVQGLVAIGYTYAHLGRLLGTRPEWPAFLAYAKIGPRGVLTRTADTISDLCRTALDGPPPTGRPAAYARTVARKHGWAPLHAWDDIDDPAEQPNLGGPIDDQPDDVLVQEAFAGRVTWGRLSHPDRVEVIRRFLAAGIGVSGMADRLRSSTSAMRGFIDRHINGQVAA